jgi:predicted DNA-binding transcriptional regulator AlpA
MRSSDLSHLQDVLIRLRVSVPEAAAALNLSVSTFYRHQNKEDFPKIHQYGGRSTVRISDLQRWSDTDSEATK